MYYVQSLLKYFGKSLDFIFASRGKTWVKKYSNWSSRLLLYQPLPRASLDTSNCFFVGAEIWLKSSIVETFLSAVEVEALLFFPFSTKLFEHFVQTFLKCKQLRWRGLNFGKCPGVPLSNFSCISSAAWTTQRVNLETFKFKDEGKML